MELGQLTFTCIEDECRYWKECAKHYKREWADVKRDYDEFSEQSRQLEAELDTILEQKDVIIQNLTSKLVIVKNENQSLTLKLTVATRQSENMLRQLKVVRLEGESMKGKIRQLEQKNDDLERAHRILNESIIVFENKLDEAYERNALLQMEVDEMQELQEQIQRLTDETKELKLDIIVKSFIKTTNDSLVGNGPIRHIDD